MWARFVTVRLARARLGGQRDSLFREQIANEVQ